MLCVSALGTKKLPTKEDIAKAIDELQNILDRNTFLNENISHHKLGDTSDYKHSKTKVVWSAIISLLGLMACKSRASQQSYVCVVWLS